MRYDLGSSGVAPSGALPVDPARSCDFVAARTSFVRAVAARYQVPEDNVAPALGASGALYSLMAALVVPGDDVLVEAPCYEPLLRIPESLGATVRCFTRAEAATFAPNVGELLGLVGARTRAVVLSNPHNPSAAVVPDELLVELAGELARRNVVLIVDEVYLELVHERATARRLHPNIATCSSLTKCFGLPWARAGWMLVAPALAAQLIHVERQVYGLLPPFGLAVGASALSDAEAFLARARSLQAGKRKLLDDFLRRHRSALACVPPPEGSLFAWVRDLRGEASLARFERGAVEHGVIVAPGEFFGSAATFRVSLTAPAESYAEGLNRLGRVLGLPDAAHEPV